MKNTDATIRNKQSGSTPLILITILLVVGLLAGLGYALYRNSNKDNTVVTTSETSTQNQKPATKSFRSKEQGIVFDYPAEWTAIEEVQPTSESDRYQTNITVKDDQNDTVAYLTTGGQVGGVCPADAAKVNTFTTIKEPQDITGIPSSNFGYSIVERGADDYGVTYGLAEDELTLGNKPVQCPTMSVNYRYMIPTNASALGSVTFGTWYAEEIEGS